MLKKIFKGLLVAMVLAGGAYASDMERIMKNAIRDAVAFNFTPKPKTSTENAGTRGAVKAFNDYYNERYGQLKSVLMNLQIDNGIQISRNVGWGNVFYNLHEYLYGAADKYELFRRLQIINSFRAAYDGKTGKIKNAKDDDLDSSILTASVLLENIVNNGGSGHSYSEAVQFSSESIMNNPLPTKNKSFIAWILFTTVWLDPMTTIEDKESVELYFDEEGILAHILKADKLIQDIYRENGGK